MSAADIVGELQHSVIPREAANGDFQHAKLATRLPFLPRALEQTCCVDQGDCFVKAQCHSETNIVKPFGQDPSLGRLVAALRADSANFEAGGRVLRLKQCAPTRPAHPSRPETQYVRLRARSFPSIAAEPAAIAALSQETSSQCMCRAFSVRAVAHMRTAL